MRPTQELEGLQQGINLLAMLTQWAVHQAGSGAHYGTAASSLLIEQLRRSLQAGLHGGAQPVLHHQPKQLLLWLMEAEHKVSEAPLLGAQEFGIASVE